jgi:hypothetical protein
MPVGRKLEPLRILIEYSAQAIEMFAVALIVIAIVHGTIRYLIRINQQVGDAYSF